MTALKENASSLLIEIILLLAKKRKKRAEQFDSFMTILSYWYTYINTSSYSRIVEL